MAEAPHTGRLFFALWPPPSLQPALERHSRALVAACGGRPVAPVDYHLTLAFLGSVRPAVRDSLVALTGGLALPRCRLVLDRSGAFRQAGVCWLAPTLTPPALEAFVAELWQRLAPLGFRPDSRPFRPHVTVCRGARAAAPAASVPALEWPLDAVVLAESAPVADARYRLLARSGTAAGCG